MIVSAYSTINCPTQNIEAEESILGGILLDPEAIGKVAPILAPAAFSIAEYRIIYSTALDLHQEGKPTDLMFVTTRLRDRGQLEKAGGQYKLAQLVSYTISAINIDQYAGLVMEKYQRRCTIEMAGKLVELSSTENFSEALKSSIDELSQISQLKQSPADLKEQTLLKAVDKARDILLQQLPEINQNLKLEMVRRDSGMSSYEWENKIIKPLKRDMESERIKLEIQVYLAETDPFRQITEKNRICSTFHLRSNYFDQMCEIIRQNQMETQQTDPQGLSLKELFELESEALSWLVPGFVPNNFSILLSGLPGSGKSLLTIDLAYALATGSSFLGEKVKPRRVLLINSDQPLNITSLYLAERGLTENDENIMVVGPNKDMAAWTVKDLDILEKLLREFQPDLTIIDSIRTTICYPLGLEEKSELVGHYMKQVERIVTKTGSLLWVHHDNKDKEKSGIGRSSGSTAIPGNVSAHWRIEAASKDPSDPNRIFSMPKTRGFEPVTLNIRYDSTSGHWQNMGQVGESPHAAQETRTIQERILQLLNQQRGVGFEAKEICTALGTDSARRVLYRMEQRSLVSTRRSLTSRAKVYFLPLDNSSEPPPSPDSPDLSHSEAGSQTDTDFQEMGHFWDTSGTPQGQQNVPETGNPDTERFSEMGHPEWDTGGGDCKNKCSPLDIAASLVFVEYWSDAVLLVANQNENVKTAIWEALSPQQQEALRTLWIYACFSAEYNAGPIEESWPSQWVCQSPQPESSTQKFNLDDLVATADPYTAQYNWHGTIQNFRNDGQEALVRWAERQGNVAPGREADWYFCHELRLIEETSDTNV